MATFTGTGEPTRKTAGAMGDIYFDTKGGDAYECVFSYRDNNDNEFDCQWKKLTDDELKKKPGFIVDTGIGQTPGAEGASPEEVKEEIPKAPVKGTEAKVEEPAEEAVAKEEEPEQKPGFK